MKKEEKILIDKFQPQRQQTAARITAKRFVHFIVQILLFSSTPVLYKKTFYFCSGFSKMSENLHTFFLHFPVLSATMFNIK